ncbi:MAG: glycosyl hydrolase 115 family protein [Acidobacteriia bacterium]|nr:glycosyl hydrolase 115 family protein [Terriglobia bacterium]
MTFRRICTIPCALAALCAMVSSGAPAQTAPWTDFLRGSWVQSGPAAQGDVILAGKNSPSQIVVGDNETAAVHQAAEFLAGDIERISGYRPPVVKTPSGDRVSIRLVTLGNGEAPAAIDAGAMQGQWESYRIVTANRAVWLVGSNPRGTAFAAFALSERLGIDPLYIWTGYTPEHRDPLVLKRTSFAQGPPAFRYRGFFHDDEDLLPRPFDANGYPLQTGDVPLDWYKRFFETALRLRMNMVAPYVRVHRRYEVQKLASDWGLYYTSHHYDILVSNPFGLVRFNLAAERGLRPEWNWFTNREGMLKFWRGGVIENRDLDVIWPVGMRGTEDRPFLFPPGTTDDDRAKTFREVIGEQVKMVRELVPQNKPPLFHFTMYSEMLPQYQRNPAAFDLPPDVIIVWPDDNDGHMRGLPAEVGRWKHGVYYHLAYLGGRLTKQLTHIVAPSTVAEQFDKIVKAGATEYMLVNVSELRDYVMGARMIADITWDAPAIYARPGPAERYTAWWSREYFGAPGGGASTAQAAETAYHKYFGVLDTPDKLWQAPDAIQELVDRLYRKVAGEAYPEVNADTLAQVHSRKGQLDEALAAEERAVTGMSLSQQRFYSVDVGLGLRVAQRQTQAAVKLEEALRAPDSDRIWQLVLEARAPLEQLETELARAEYPPFDRWYHESWIRTALSPSNPHRPYNQLRAFISSEGHGRLVR